MANPEAAAKQLHRIALDHLNDDQGRRVARLYRIFVYDAPPAEWKGHTPISKRSVDYGRSDLAHWRRPFHQHLRSLRKVALRLGHIPTTQVNWQLTPDALKALVTDIIRPCTIISQVAVTPPRSEVTCDWATS